MTFTMLYFGELREQLHLTTETVTLSMASPIVADLVAYLTSRGHPWSDALSSSDPLRVAVNQEMASLETAIPDNAEVALFRPVTGG